jgi:hypothetical protein
MGLQSGKLQPYLRILDQGGSDSQWQITSLQQKITAPKSFIVKATRGERRQGASRIEIKFC